MPSIVTVTRFNTILDDSARRLYEPVIATLFALAPETMTRKYPAANVQQGFMLAAVLQLCRNFPRTRILCVGSYEDTALESLLKIGIRAEGIDPNVNGIDLDAFLSMHPNRLGTYDVVFSTSVLEHVEHDERFVSGIASLIAPGGYGVFTCDFRNAWKSGEPLPRADLRFYRSEDLQVRLLNSMPGCQLLDSPDWDAFEPDFEYEGCRYNFATFAVQKDRGS